MTIHRLIQFTTDFGDQAVLSPLALGIGLVFACSAWKRAAVGWLVGIGGCFALMLVLKLCFQACGHDLPGDITSPSGHTAASAAVYGALLGLLARAMTGQVRWTFPLASCVALVFGSTRLLLHIHTLTEVVIGSVVGVTGAVVMTWMAGDPPIHVRARWLASTVVAILLLFHGFRMPAEAAIHTISMHLWPLTACR